MSNNKYQRQNINIFARVDWILIILILLLATVSVIAIHSAMTSGQYGTDFGTRQIMFYALGFVIALGLMCIPFKLIKSYTWILYTVGVLSLLILYIAPVSSITPIINGAKSWYQFGFFSIQPSEFVKIIYILTMAYVISQHNKYKLTDTLAMDLRLLLKLILVSVLPMILILLQNDMGTVLVMIAIFLGLVIVSGISWWLIIPTFTVAATTGIALILGILYRPDILEKYLGIHPYQFERIYSWLTPEAFQSDSGFQLTNSLIAIGSGGITGKGYTDGIIYIPENHTDFIFTIIGEEFGFIGSTIVILILFMLIMHLIRMAFQATDSFASYFIIGYIALLVFHIFQNIGMTIQLVPITGLPLPFISYGGSGLWSNMVAVGVLLSMYFHHLSGPKLK
ncbi:rod shape-determining protein RodA [Jeotgalicoccus huakuii]|uniref:FtsW/RodA/SpoVE family cell cycle protein n=1 Tax=Jeotgalicoccus TaxID=227979 RepID=UPI000410EF2E|nr:MULTISPECIES: FtsW/RodA/SpoVE family cell cycle protein [Jeotgalicoccus]MCK1975832.1 rod shape-determining protein RodA [Jeotgalicoccus huakuii]QQD84882.1 rod shape-determining protein RodA [Jeotgalicoccus sp. ATCC 8456]